MSFSFQPQSFIFVRLNRFQRTNGSLSDFVYLFFLPRDGRHHFITSVESVMWRRVCTCSVISSDWAWTLNNMASGSSEKRFACGKCSRHFNLAETLFGHYRSHMQEEYACSSCFDEFATTQSFLIHRDDSPDCHAAKAISKTSVNRKRKQKDMEDKLKGLAREFQLQIEARDVWVCS